LKIDSRQVHNLDYKLWNGYSLIYN
jgi:hypothetical protein